MKRWPFKSSEDESSGFSAETCEKYRDYLVKAAMRITQDRFYAEDVVQETMRKLILTSKNLQDVSEQDLKRYMGKAVIQNAFTYMKKIWREIPTENLPEEVIDDVVLQSVLSADTRDQILACIAKLTARQRRVLALAYYEDWETNQIAEALGISMDGVRMLKKRGLDNMRELLQKEGFER